MLGRIWWPERTCGHLCWKTRVVVAWLQPFMSRGSICQCLRQGSIFSVWTHHRRFGLLLPTDKRIAQFGLNNLWIIARHLAWFYNALLSSRVLTTTCCRTYTTAIQQKVWIQRLDCWLCVVFRGRSFPFNLLSWNFVDSIQFWVVFDDKFARLLRKYYGLARVFLLQRLHQIRRNQYNVWCLLWDAFVKLVARRTDTLSAPQKVVGSENDGS